MKRILIKIFNMISFVAVAASLILSLGSCTNKKKSSKVAVTPPSTQPAPPPPPPSRLFTPSPRSQSSGNGRFHRNRIQKKVQNWSQTSVKCDEDRGDSESDNSCEELDPDDAPLDSSDASSSKKVKEWSEGGQIFTNYGRYNLYPPNYTPPMPQNSVAQTEISPTGAVDPRSNAYMDSRLDSIMPVLRKHIENISNATVRNESIDMSLSIRGVRVDTNMDNRTVFLKLNFDAGEGSPLKNEVTDFQFYGSLNEKNVAIIRRNFQIGNKSYPFHVTIICADQNLSTCHNTIIAVYLLEKENSNDVCKYAFLVHRSGHVHVTYDPRYYYASKNTPNPDFQEFMTYLKHTSDASKRVLECLSTRGRVCNRVSMEVPGAHEVHYRSWAAAYGRSQFILSFYSVTTIDKPIQDVFEFSGPLISSDNYRQPNQNLIVSGYLRDITTSDPSRNVVDNHGHYAPMIQSAEVLRTDGDGTMSIRVSFGSYDSVILNSITNELVVPTRNFTVDLDQ